MVAFPIISGVLPTAQAEFGTVIPKNMEPVIVESGISKGQLRMASGAIPWVTGPGIDRGGHVWNGQHFRVMGENLVRINSAGAVEILGNVGGTGQAGFDHSFDRLAIRSGTALWYWDGTTLSQMTDPDLGPVLDHIWIDGYFMATDGKFVVVTELNDPNEVKPLKYGSAESDPDPIVGLVKLRGEAYVIGRNTIELFANRGGSGFPFAVVRSATIPFGAVSAQAVVQFAQTIAFVGSERGGALGVFLAGQGTASRISSRTIDDALANDPAPDAVTVERRVYRNEARLIVHLSNASYQYNADASQKAGEPVWVELRSRQTDAYRLRNALVVGEKIIVGDLNSPALGILTDDLATHFGEPVEWRFDVGQFNEPGKGLVLREIELIGMTGRGPYGGGEAFMSYTLDGETFSLERAKSLGERGQRKKRVAWRPRVRVPNYLGLRFRGYGQGFYGVAACEVDASPQV